MNNMITVTAEEIAAFDAMHLGMDIGVCQWDKMESVIEEDQNIQMLDPEEFKAFCSARPIERIIYDSTEYNAPFCNPCFDLQFASITVLPERAERPAACMLSGDQGKMIFKQLYTVGVDDSAQLWTVATLYCKATGNHKIMIDWKTEKGGKA